MVMMTREGDLRNEAGKVRGSHSHQSFPCILFGLRGRLERESEVEAEMMLWSYA